MGSKLVGIHEGDLLARVHRLVVFKERAATFELAAL